jgi:hypothetical protein
MYRATPERGWLTEVFLGYGSMDEQERQRRIAKIDRELGDFAYGITDEYVQSDGTRWRRFRDNNGEQIERLSADGAREVMPFTAVLRDWFLEIVNAKSEGDIPDAWRRLTGGLIPYPGEKDQRNWVEPTYRP